jgi:hypothetical protein
MMRRFIIEAIAESAQARRPDGSLSMAVTGSTMPALRLLPPALQMPIVTAATVSYSNSNDSSIAGQPASGTTLRFRLTCLNCGLITEALYHAMQRHLIDHACGDREEPHWHQVVRDAVIEGRDKDIVRLIASELGLLAGE